MKSMRVATPNCFLKEHGLFSLLAQHRLIGKLHEPSFTDLYVR